MGYVTTDGMGGVLDDLVTKAKTLIGPYAQRVLNKYTGTAPGPQPGAEAPPPPPVPPSDMPGWVLPVVGIGAAFLILPRLLGGR